jgi:alpha-L-fucosidase
MQLLKHGDPNGKYWMPAMSDAPLRGYNGRHEWFWEPDDEEHIFPLENLMNMYYGSVGNNSTLILGLTPDSHGLIPEPDVKRLKEWGNEIKRRFSVPIVQTSGKGKTLELILPSVQEINTIVIQEDIKNGERIRDYKIQANINGKWQIIADGTCIGHKRILTFKPVFTNKIRLLISESLAVPQVKNFSVFNVN